MRIDSRRIRLIRILLWIALASVVFSFVGLSVMSAFNYYDVAYAKLSVRANADLVMEASGIGMDGVVLNTTTFWFNVTINVTNPSRREMRLQYLKYQCWLEDYESEDIYSGLDRYFRSMFVEDQGYAAESGVVGAESRRTFSVSWQLNSQTNRLDFDITQRMLNYALLNSTQHLRWDQVFWNHFFVFQLIIPGVPTEYFGPNSGYLIDLPVVRLYQGVNLDA